MGERFAVIGGLGFLGQHLVDLLLTEFQEGTITVIDMPPDYQFENERVKYVGNVNITNSDLKPHLRDKSAVFHLAAIMKFGARNQDDLLHINGEGAQRVIEACEAVNLDTLVFVSSIATMGYDPKGREISTESTPINWDRQGYAYYGYSKYVGESHALEASKRGNINRVVIGCPGIMLGANDPKSKPLFDLVKRLPILSAPGGGTNYVDVRDVAFGLIQAYRNGTNGEKYILANTNITHADFFREVAAFIGKRRWIISLPSFLGSVVGNLIRPLEYIAPKSSRMAKEGVMKSFHKRYYSNNKAKKQLDWSPRYSIQDTIQYAMEG